MARDRQPVAQRGFASVEDAFLIAAPTQPYVRVRAALPELHPLRWKVSALLSDASSRSPSWPAHTSARMPLWQRRNACSTGAPEIFAARQETFPLTGAPAESCNAAYPIPRLNPRRESPPPHDLE